VRQATALRPLGLTPAQSEVLRLLGEHAPLTLTGLGELLVCESGTNPSRLVEPGLVSRTTPDAGGRQVILQLTAKLPDESLDVLLLAFRIAPTD
jgi:DNA-binding MarR family transcriptional regulator